MDNVEDLKNRRRKVAEEALQEYSNLCAELGDLIAREADLGFRIEDMIGERNSIGARIDELTRICVDKRRHL